MTDTTTAPPSAARRSLCAALASLPTLSLAQLRVEITGVGSQQFPVSIANFAREGQVPVELEAIIRADLTRSGLFRIVDAGSQPVPENAAVALGEWKARGADALAIGSAGRLADGRFDVRYRLLDTVKQGQLDGLAYVSPQSDLRLTAHRIADRIYEKITGERGVFATRIAYVVQTSRNAWELHIADADGANSQAALRSREPIISPAWSPDGSQLAYVSFESLKPVVYVHTVMSGQRRAVANFRGSNSAPAWSPDGRTLAVTLTREGNSQVFLMNADGGNVRRITTSSGIDTEPAFSPDGQAIYFTSDRGGGPQIYRMPATGGGAQRVTFNGDYNISARVSPDGRLLAYVARRGGQFKVHVLDLASGQETPVTDTNRDESPSFAPNGRMLLYATEVGGRGILASASVDGRVRTRLSGPAGDIREPTWGPFIK
jgi:TolB protein